MTNTIYKLILMIFSLTFISSSSNVEIDNKKKHNILFISVDDLRPMTNSYGNNQMITPHLDKLVSEGVQFDNAYTNVAVCGGSRASIMTGVRPSYNRFLRFYSRASEDTPNAVSLQRIFKENGYTALSYGKIYHHPDDFEEDWSKPPVAAKQFDYQAEESWDIIRKEGGNNPHKNPHGPAWEVADVSDDVYSDGKVTGLAIKSLKKFKKTGEPFFLAVGYVSPHLPFIQPKKYWDMYSDEDILLADNTYQPKNSPQAAMHNFSELRNGYVGIPKRGLLDEDLSRNLVHGYYASVTYMDVLIGRLVTALDELGLRDNTTIILWGDHGFFLGEHGLWCKHSSFYEAIRVPLIVSSPNMKKNVKTSSMAELVDVYPTLCEIANIDPPDYLDGVSLVPILEDPSKKLKNEIYTRYQRHEAIVDENYSFTEFVNLNPNDKIPDGQPGMANMLFDMNNDKDQNIDISNRPSSQGLVKKYKEKLARMRKYVNQKKVGK